MPQRVPYRARRLLCVVPYPANTGFAWNYIEGLYAGVADQLALDAVVTYVSYLSIEQPPRSLRGSNAQPLVLDASLSSGRSIFETVAAIRRLQIDTVYFTDLATWHWALPLLRLAGVRWIVAHDHTSGHRDRPTGVKWFAKWLRARIPGMAADRIVTVSEYVARRQREVALAPADRVFPLVNGLTLPDMDTPPLAIDDAAGVDFTRPTVACVCRSAVEKGVDVLFRAFSSMLDRWPDDEPRPQLVYLGNGPVFDDLRALRDTLPHGADIQMLGYRQDVASFLRIASVCVVPSRWEDACPLSVLEPMAWGKAVVASAVGGVPEEINSPEVGVLVPKNDEGALAAAVRDLLLNEPRRSAIGRAARERIRNELSREKHLKAIVSHLTSFQPDPIVTDSSSQTGNT